MNYQKTILSAIGAGMLLWACDSKTEDSISLPEAPEGNNRKDISQDTAEVKLETIQLPENFSIDVWAANVPNARSMAVSDNGIVFVGNRQEKNVYALIDSDGDGKANYRYTLAEDLNMPNGVAYKDGDLYVAEVSRILKFPDIKNHLADPSFEVIYDQYPTEGHHGWKFIAFGPDGQLYIPVGAPCNICESEEEIFASITKLDVTAENPSPEIVAHGVRNTVGFDWHPNTGKLWFTDNGRDNMGDDTPECELNVITEEGLHYGYPYWHQGNVKDPEFGDQGKDESAYIAPVTTLGPHVAPLGMRFYEGSMFPDSFSKSIFIAKHGSWNRSKKSGYVVTSIAMDGNDTKGESTFASGWLDEESQEVWGRPVDVQELADGSLLVSDDMANCIYRISYSK
ncbi:sorbosone dehydrogenase [Echinicola pacifica]|uniref:Sorbosone dehydrogenase n=1 Tax=Echinicola pacifica TaxID=346377 RepID=A0A918PX72_9BACT|nr:PQQ-dependent sugar dehydrogenase [Echinicola pacifica]GGZ25946.1 sorbosone dehydrogenase [Echinicola pacifica]